MAWTLYGLFVSQCGDLSDRLEDNGELIKDYLRHYFGFKHDFLPVVAGVVVGLPVVFAFIFAYGIKTFNFQRR